MTEDQEQRLILSQKCNLQLIRLMECMEIMLKLVSEERDQALAKVETLETVERAKK